MAMAWSLHLSEQANFITGEPPLDEVQSRSSRGSAVTEEFVMEALCKLLEAAPYYQIIPIVPKLCEFVQWFDDTSLLGYRGRISARVEEAVQRREDFRIDHMFHKFHCTLYI